MKYKEGTAFSRSFFKGYEMKPVLGDDGIVRNEYVYAGPLYILDGPGYKWWLNKAIHSFMLILTAFFIMLSGVQTSVVNTVRIAQFPVFIMAMATVVRFFCVIFSWASPRQMKERDYKWAVTWLKYTCAISAVCSLLSLAISIIIIVIYKEFAITTIIITLIHIPEGASSLVSYLIERKSSYRIEKAN